jgi:RNA polymerase sigma factor (sigma-70 family)
VTAGHLAETVGYMMRTRGFTEHRAAVSVSSVNFEAVYVSERARLMRYLMAQGATQYEADDAVQEAFLDALKNAGVIRYPRAWLYRVALREYLKAGARARNRETLTGEALASGNVAEFNLDEQAIVEAARKLPPRQRMVFGLTMAEFTPSEIAEQLGCEPAAVRQSLRKARDHVAEQMGIIRRNPR